MSDQPNPAVGGDQHPAAPGPAGAPGDAVGAFEAALVAAAKATPTDTADPTVSLAFALGWQMAELFRPQLRDRTERRDGDLPGLGSLGDDQRLEISVDQIQAAAFQLTPAIQKAGLTPPTAQLAAVGTALTDWDADGQTAVEALHLELLGTLTAADFRLGKAYGLGRALADTCRKPSDADGVKEELDRYRVANLLAWLDDLSTALPAHAAHSVYASLKRWSAWTATQQQLPDSTVATLRRQGDLWRSLLSDEKRGTEMLEIGNYVDAAAQVASRMSSVFWRALWHFKAVSFVVLCLLAATVVLLLSGSSSDIVAGSGTLLAALGLSWKGVGGALGQLAGKLEQPLWGAVLDTAIADAITLQPANAADHLGRGKLASDLAERSKPARPAADTRA
jgi:hypothetical protein